TAKVRIESRPGGAATGEQPQPVHRDFEWPRVRIFGAIVDSPDAPQVVTPDRLPVRRQGAQIVVHHRPLQEIETARVLAIVALELSHRSRQQQDVTIQAQYGLPARLTKDMIPWRCCARGIRELHVSRTRALLDEPTCLIAPSIVNHQQLDTPEILVEP